MKKDWMIRESELDDDQIKVLMATLEKSCIVSGCAGSGKSVLALIKAQRIQKELGDNYKIIVYTKTLCNYMNVGKEELGLKNPFYYHWEWRNKLHCPAADYIIVDEIQDFTADEIQEFIDAANKAFFFFGDTAQSVYEEWKDTMSVEDIIRRLTINKTVKSFELYRNYRLPIPVAKVALKVGIDAGPYIESTYKSVENTKPCFIKYNDRDEELNAIQRIIRNRNFTDVAILLPNNEDVDQVYDYLQDFGCNCEVKCRSTQDNKDNLDFTTTNPKIMTYHSAKGLQFEAVFLPFIEDFNGDRKALYVAMTRTYRYLYVLYSNHLPDPLSTIDNSLYENTETNQIEDI